MNYGKLVIGAFAIFLVGWVIGSSSASGALGRFVSDTLTLLVQYAVGSKQAVIGTRQAEASRISSEAAMLTAKNTGARNIATLRMSWLEGLRKTISEYHSILMTAGDRINKGDHRRLSDLGTNLDLMLNLNEKNQKKLWDVLDKIYITPNLEKRQAMDVELMAAGRVVLKAEWEKIKQEMRGDGTAI